MATEKILVPVDFSENSLQALDYAANFAAALDAAVEVLSVIEPITYAVPGDIYAGFGTQVGRIAEEQRKAARAELAAIETRLRERGLEASSSLRSGNAVAEIVQASEDLGADVILMATHGRTGLSHALLGSVAERVVRTARCGVLTVRPQKRAAKKKAKA